MKEYKRVFLDTAPIIYYLQRNDLYYKAMNLFWQRYANCDLVTSTITVIEYLTYPYRQKDLKMIQNFYDFVDNMDVEIVNIDIKLAEQAALIRAEYDSFKTADSIQLATACKSACDLFLTNDKQLKQFVGLDCMLVSEIC